MHNSFGHIFKITTFGESHGVALGVVIDGCPSGVMIDENFIQHELDRRRPGQSRFTTQRQEGDKVEILSGVFEGKTTGMPIALIVRNADQRSKDYDHLKEAFRPSHADFTYWQKYEHTDYRGGGRSSARETVARVAAGAVAKLFLKKIALHIQAYVSQVGNIEAPPLHELDFSMEENAIRCPHTATAEKMMTLIDETRKNRDTIGGVVSCVIKNTPVGLGEPIFNKLHAALGHAMLSLPAVKGYEYGSGFAGVSMYGSQHNDIFENTQGKITTRTNHSGGIQGGISNGEDIYFRVAFKPVATIMRDQPSINKQGESVTLTAKGRHDPCVVPRAVPIVEAMAALVLADFYLLSTKHS